MFSKIFPCENSRTAATAESARTQFHTELGPRLSHSLPLVFRKVPWIAEIAIDTEIDPRAAAMHWTQ